MKKSSRKHVFINRMGTELGYCITSELSHCGSLYKFQDYDEKNTFVYGLVDYRGHI